MRVIARLLVFAGLAFTGLHLILRPRRKSAPLVIGHRGAVGLAPENTLESIRAAQAQGAQYIEVDVQRTVDGVLVCFHDDTLERLTGSSGTIAEKTLAEIQALDAGSHFSAEFAGERIPTLDEVLAYTTAQGLTLVIEPKSPYLSPGMDAQLIDLIRQHEAAEQVMVICFDHEWLNDFKRALPEVPVGYIWVRGQMPRPGLRGEIMDCHWSAPLVNPWLVRWVQRRGFTLWVWTVDNALLMRVLVAIGVVGITTNRPDRWPFKMP